MLDKNTLEWLRTREKEEYYNGYYFCAHSNTIRSAEWNNITGRSDVPWVVDTREDYRDAAEFEARVSAKLANNAGPEPCEHEEKHYHCPWPRSVIEGKRTCSFCRMKYARIEVEREMDRP